MRWLYRILCWWRYYHCDTQSHDPFVTMATPADVTEVLGHLATRKAADEIRKIINSAMAWQPSENGPSYDQRRNELFVKLEAALALSSNQHSPQRE